MRKMLAIVLLLAPAGLITLACVRHADREQLAQVTQAGPSTDTPQLSIQVLEKTTRTPLAGVRVVLVPATPEPGDEAAERVSGSRGDLHKAPITGRDGRVLFELPPALDLELSAYVADGPRPESQALSFFRPGERRELVLELRRIDEMHVVGKVVSAASGDPIAGARVKLIEAQLDDSGSSAGPWIRRDLGQATTGSDGRFDLSLSTWRSPHLRVEADGYGLRLADPSGNHEDLQHSLLVELEPASTLDVRLLDSSGGPVAGAVLVAEAQGTSLARCRDAGPLLPPESWKLETGIDGRARLSGLPAGVGLRVEARRKDKLLHRESNELRLDPGEARGIEWRIEAPPQLRGLVLDQDGQPVRGQEIWLAQESSWGSRYFEAFDRGTVVASDRTDDAGRFVLDGVQPGHWRLGPAPRGSESGLAEAGAVAPVPIAVRTSNTRRLDLTLHVQRRTYLRGTVLSPDGAPLGNCPVSADSAHRSSWQHARSSLDGTFVLGPLEPGTWTVQADRSGPFARAEPLRAKAGDSGLVLRLKPGGSLRVHVVDARTREAREAKLLIGSLPRGTNELNMGTMWTGTDPDGTSSEDGLDPGRYGIAASTTDGKFAVCSGVDVVAGAAPAEVELALQPGGTLRIGYAGARPYVRMVITVTGVPLGIPDPLRKGETKDFLAPAGSSVLELWWRGDGPPHLKPIELEPGETKELTITDED
jgi:hypothetical protein